MKSIAIVSLNVAPWFINIQCTYTYVDIQLIAVKVAAFSQQWFLSESASSGWTASELIDTP